MKATEEEIAEFSKLPPSLKKVCATACFGMDGAESIKYTGYTHLTIRTFKSRLFAQLGYMGLTNTLKLAVFIVRRPEIEKIVREVL